MPPQRTAAGTRGAKEGQAKPSAPCAETDQRRARNRLAQMASRERKTAQIRRLEHQLALAQQHDRGAAVQALMEENANLRQSFLTVRKRLLSLSTTASLLAESLIPLINGKQESACTPHPQEDSTSPPNKDKESPPVESDAEGDPFLANYVDASRCEPIIDLGDDFPFLEADQEYTPFVPGENGVALPSNVMSTGPVDRSIAEEPSESRSRHRSSTETFYIPSNLFQQLQSPSIMMPPRVPARQRSQMSMHIDFIKQTMRSKGWANSSSPHPPKVLDAMLHEYLKQCWPMMIPWFHLIKAADVIRSVLWWQVTNSADAASQLSSVHTPTFIQLSTPHPSILDWMPHATMRDMLIMNQDSFDLDTVVADLAAAYVYETESNEGLGGVGETRNLMDAVHNSLRYGLPLVGNAGSQSGSGQNAVSAGGGASLHTTLTRPTAAAVIHQFKIDSSFFNKYPALYDPTAVGRRTASPPIAFGNVPTAVQFTSSAAQAYMRTAT